MDRRSQRRLVKLDRLILTEAGRAQSLLTAEGIWKVFGPRPQKALDAAHAGATRAEIQEELGNVIGVRDVSFSASQGETFVIMGLSGSGKSTLLRCVACLTASTLGDVSLDGVSLTAMSEAELREVRRAKLSMVFQHFALFPHRKVIDNAAYGLEVQGIDRSTRHAKANEILDLVGLGGWGDHYPEQLSGGMQQRVGLARALVVEPSVMFFDEPFSALDPLIRREMQEELLRLQAELQRTIVFVTHDFDEAIRLGDRIAIMKDGEFDQMGTAQELIASPATDYVREFTKDVSRTKVLTVADVLRSATAPRGNGIGDGASASGPEPVSSVPASTTLDAVLPALLGAGEIAVTDGAGNRIGLVDRAAVQRILDPSS